MKSIGEGSTEEVNEAVGSNHSSVDQFPQTSLAFMESLTLPLVQEVVISADLRCIECQNRISNVISRFHAETESVMVNLTEKKVVVTFKYVRTRSAQITSPPRNLFSKVAMIKRIFGSSRP